MRAIKPIVASVDTPVVMVPITDLLTDIKKSIREGSDNTRECFDRMEVCLKDKASCKDFESLCGKFDGFIKESNARAARLEERVSHLSNEMATASKVNDNEKSIKSANLKIYITIGGLIASNLFQIIKFLVK